MGLASQAAVASLATLLRYPGLVAGAGCTELFLASVVRSQARDWLRESVCHTEEGGGGRQHAWDVFQACEQFAGCLEASVRTLCGSGTADADSEGGADRSRRAVSDLYCVNRSLVSWLQTSTGREGNCSGAVYLKGWHCTRATPVTVLKYRFQGPLQAGLCPFPQPEPPTAQGTTTTTRLTCDEGTTPQVPTSTPPTPALAATHRDPLFPLGYSRHAAQTLPPVSSTPLPETGWSSDDADVASDLDEDFATMPGLLSGGDAGDSVEVLNAARGSHFSNFPATSRRSGVSARVVDVTHTKKMALQLAVQAAVAILRLRGAVRRTAP